MRARKARYRVSQETQLTLADKEGVGLWHEVMATERNAPCPCGSGKKYKKCCLAKDEAAARNAATVAAREAESAREAEEAAREAEWERQEQEGRKSQNHKLTADATSGAPTAARELDWPPLNEADQELVDAWWREVEPVYRICPTYEALVRSP